MILFLKQTVLKVMRTQIQKPFNLHWNLYIYICVCVYEVQLTARYSMAHAQPDSVGKANLPVSCICHS